MTRSLKSTSKIAGAVALVALVTALPAGAAPSDQPPMPVRVTNTPENKVPVVLDQLVTIGGKVGIDAAASTLKIDPSANEVRLAPLDRRQVQKALDIRRGRTKTASTISSPCRRASASSLTTSASGGTAPIRTRPRTPGTW